MDVIQKKISMLGAFATGKTSMVQQFVHSMFSEKYHTTVGVKVDKKEVKLGSGPMNLLLWDLAGEDEFQRVQTSYLRGSSGYMFVADGTRAGTLDHALELRKTVREMVGDAPSVLALNKFDLKAEWDLPADAVNGLAEPEWRVLRTSAKTGEGVEEAFLWLAQQMR